MMIFNMEPDPIDRGPDYRQADRPVVNISHVILTSYERSYSARVGVGKSLLFCKTMLLSSYLSTY